MSFRVQPTPEALAAVGTLDHLETVILTSDANIAPHLSPLSRLNRLQSVALIGPGVTDAGLAHLAGMTSLKSLSIHDNPKVTDAGLEHPGGMKKLHSLNLSNTKGSRWA